MVEAKKILIADDERIIALDIKSIVKSFGFDTTEIAANGAETYEMYLREKPDIVLLDIMMKEDLDGIEAAKKIHRNGNTPIIFITASTDEDTFKKAKETDPIDIINKPINEDKLYEALRKAINQNAEY